MFYGETRSLPLALSFVLAACGSPAGGSSGGGGPEGPRIVITARPEAIAWPRTVELGGTLEASERVEIAARIEGAVIALEVDLGDRVERGDTLARITPEDFSARVAQSDAELSQARTELTRLEQMEERELASRAQVEQARTRVRVTEAQRRLASRQLRDTRVIAPFGGAIAERRVSLGAFVRVGTPLFVLVATSPLRLALDVPERHSEDVRTGTMVRILSEGGAELEVRVARVAPIVDPSTRTFRVEVEVPREEATLRPGMYVRARVELGVVSDAVRIPRAAVFEVLGRSRVALVVDGRAQPHDVELIGEGDGVAIVRGLGSESPVVVRSPGLLAPGTEVAEEPAGEEGAEAAEIPGRGSGDR